MQLDQRLGAGHAGGDGERGLPEPPLCLRGERRARVAAPEGEQGLPLRLAVAPGTREVRLRHQRLGRHVPAPERRGAAGERVERRRGRAEISLAAEDASQPEASVGVHARGGRHRGEEAGGRVELSEVLAREPGLEPAAVGNRRQLGAERLDLGRLRRRRTHPQPGQGAKVPDRRRLLRLRQQLQRPLVPAGLELRPRSGQLTGEHGVQHLEAHPAAGRGGGDRRRPGGKRGIPDLCDVVRHEPLLHVRGGVGGCGRGCLGGCGEENEGGEREEHGGTDEPRSVKGPPTGRNHWGFDLSPGPVPDGYPHPDRAARLHRRHGPRAVARAAERPRARPDRVRGVRVRRGRVLPRGLPPQRLPLRRAHRLAGARRNRGASALGGGGALGGAGVLSGVPRRPEPGAEDDAAGGHLLGDPRARGGGDAARDLGLGPVGGGGLELRDDAPLAVAPDAARAAERLQDRACAADLPRHRRGGGAALHGPGRAGHSRAPLPHPRAGRHNAVPLLPRPDAAAPAADGPARAAGQGRQPDGAGGDAGGRVLGAHRLGEGEHLPLPLQHGGRRLRHRHPAGAAAGEGRGAGGRTSSSASGSSCSRSLAALRTRLANVIDVPERPPR